MAEVTQFPDCCGFIILNKFKGGHPGANPEDCISEDACRKFLQSNEQKYFKERAGLFAILSEPQNQRLGKVFLERRWEILIDGQMNPRSGTKVWMYHRNLNYTAAREKKIYA